jgi:hypothetical protein
VLAVIDRAAGGPPRTNSRPPEPAAPIGWNGAGRIDVTVMLGRHLASLGRLLCAFNRCQSTAARLPGRRSRTLAASLATTRLGGGDEVVRRDPDDLATARALVSLPRSVSIPWRELPGWWARLLHRSLRIGRMPARDRVISCFHPGAAHGIMRRAQSRAATTPPFLGGIGMHAGPVVLSPPALMPPHSLPGSGSDPRSNQRSSDAARLRLCGPCTPLRAASRNERGARPGGSDRLGRAGVRQPLARAVLRGAGGRLTARGSSSQRRQRGGLGQQLPWSVRRTGAAHRCDLRRPGAGLPPHGSASQRRHRGGMG